MLPACLNSPQRASADVMFMLRYCHDYFAYYYYAIVAHLRRRHATPFSLRRHAFFMLRYFSFAYAAIFDCQMRHTLRRFYDFATPISCFVHLRRYAISPLIFRCYAAVFRYAFSLLMLFMPRPALLLAHSATLCHAYTCCAALRAIKRYGEGAQVQRESDMRAAA